MTKILGIAGSLRNARWGKGNHSLMKDLKECSSEEELKSYLVSQSEIHHQNFVDSGRAQGLSFDHIYKNLKKLHGNAGLSNSEVALAAALWSSYQKGCEIEHLSLSEYFPAAEQERNINELKDQLRNADGFLISGPVYFGDRGSLVQDLIDLIKNDSALRQDLEHKVYAGIAVGAKRNGGQETTLIYQLMDLINIGFSGVGNDSDTTAQYGGTGHAGDVGSMVKDDYGLWTSMGAGRRIAKIAKLIQEGKQQEFQGRMRLMFWLLQDKNHVALNYISSLANEYKHIADTVIVDATDQHIARCIACDICPTNIDTDPVYRCIIKNSRDAFGEMHESMLSHDAVIPVVYCPEDRDGLASKYQRFMERTRYLRRGDYVFSDTLTTPFVIEDLGVQDSMAIRMSTSMIRHHTVLSKPIIAYRQENIMLNHDQVRHIFQQFLNHARVLTAGRLYSHLQNHSNDVLKYNPVGYVLSTEKDKEDEKLRQRRAMTEERHQRHYQDAEARLIRANKKTA